jgi:hypothetical protein
VLQNIERLIKLDTDFGSAISLQTSLGSATDKQQGMTER